MIQNYLEISNVLIKGKSLKLKTINTIILGYYFTFSP